MLKLLFEVMLGIFELCGILVALVCLVSLVELVGDRTKDVLAKDELSKQEKETATNHIDERV